MDIKTKRHQARFPKVHKRVPFFIILIRALLWLMFAPNKRKFAKVSATYKFGGIRLCWCRAIERFSQKDFNLFTYCFILIRVLRGLFFSPQRRKFAKAWATYKYGGIRLCWHRAVQKFGGKEYLYDHKRNQLSRPQSEYLIACFSKKPLISIVVPVYKVDFKWLDKCIQSVLKQFYKNWELLLVDDASGCEDIKRLIESKSSLDDRIRPFFLGKNVGIADATNFAIERAQGRFIGFLDHDDELAPDALTWVLWALNKNPNALWFYSDEDKVSANDKHHSPYFKPDYSPEHLFSIMFTCHFSVYSAEVIRQVSGLRLGFDGAQDHDLALRISEVVPKDKVIHIPRILYHWREIPGSTASDNLQKPLAAVNGRKAVIQALERRSLKATVKSNQLLPTLYQVELKPSQFPKVTIIIPTRNYLPILKKCIDSIRQHTNYPNYEIMVIDNNSDDPAFLEYIKKQQSENTIKVFKYSKPFNHSDMNNLAIASVDSEFVLLTNNDIEIISENWLEQLVATAQTDPAIALVGVLLVYPDSEVQHGGIVLGLNEYAGHAHKHMDSRSNGYFGRLHAIQEMSGITAALALVRRSSFEDVGGFNNNRYPTSFNDVDLCTRLRKRGYRCIYNPMVRAIHYETKTRPITREELDYQKRLMDDYSEILSNDPFYNPNLALDNERFQGFREFPVEKQIPELCRVSNSPNT